MYTLNNTQVRLIGLLMDESRDLRRCANEAARAASEVLEWVDGGRVPVSFNSCVDLRLVCDKVDSLRRACEVADLPSELVKLAIQGDYHQVYAHIRG